MMTSELKISRNVIVSTLIIILYILLSGNKLHAKSRMNEEDFRQALIKEGESKEAKLLRIAGVYHYRKQLYKRAARLFANAYIFDNRTDTLLMVARSSLRAGWDSEALIIYTNLINIHPAKLLERDIKTECEENLAVLLPGQVDINILREEIVREEVESASQSYHSQDFVNAREELSLAYSMKPLPRLLFNIGQTYKREDNMEAASVLYNRFVGIEHNTHLALEAETYLQKLQPITFPSGRALVKRLSFWLTLTLTVGVLSAWSAGLAIRQSASFRLMQ